MEFVEQEAEFNLNFGEIAGGGTSGVTSVNGKTGVVVLRTSDLENNSDYQNGTEVAEAIQAHNQDPEAHPDIREDITDIEELIPNQATADNKLTDQNFVNSSIATNTANYIYKTEAGKKVPFDSLEELEAYSGTLTNNDYAFVIGTDSEGNTTYTRYKYTASTSSWAEEYVLNNSSFTAVQWAAINSGITSGKIEQIDEAIAGKVDKVTGKGLSTNDFTDEEKTKLAGLENTVLESSTGQSTTAGMTQKAITEALASAGGGDPVYSTKTTSNSASGGAVYIGDKNASQNVLEDPTTTDNHYKYFWALPSSATQVPRYNSVNIMGSVNNTDAISILSNAGGYGSVAIGGLSADATFGYSVSIGPSTSASGQYDVSMGYNAKNSSSSSNTDTSTVSIGREAGRASEDKRKGAINLGAFSKTTSDGEMNIGSTNTAYGYNSTNYRLLTGVHDGINAHDAATYGQLQALEARIAALEGNA